MFIAVKHASKAMLISHPSKPSPGGSIVATASVAGIRSGSGGSKFSPFPSPSSPFKNQAGIQSGSGASTFSLFPL